MVLQNTCTGLEAFWDDFPPKNPGKFVFKKSEFTMEVTLRIFVVLENHLKIALNLY